MNLLDIAQQDGRIYKRVSSNNGGEYHGPCPTCAGVDRFHVWPEQGEHGTFWCRGCGLAGDAIEYLMKIEGKSFPAACAEIGKALPEQEEYQAPQFKRPAAETFTPRETSAPADLWIQHATKLLDWSHDQLLANPDQLAWLAARGLDLEAVKRYRLGWNPGEKGKDLYRAREAWGLPNVFKEDGKTKKKLWLPIGLVIPCFDAPSITGTPGALLRIRIRRPEGEPRYYLVPGSGTAPMVLPPLPEGDGRGEGKARAWVIVESELDALLVHHLAGDLVGAISQGNSTAKPDAYTMTCLNPSVSILVALDSDQAGMQASVWWKKEFPQAERHPVPVGKDPGDAFKAGIDIREWIKVGLPPALTLPKSAPKPPAAAPRPPAPESPQDNSGAGVSATTSEAGEAPGLEPRTSNLPLPEVHIITAKDGRQVHITDDRAEYQRLTAEGLIVFDSQELALVKLSGADQDQAAGFLDLKQTFGIRISEVRPDVPAPESGPSGYRGKFNKENP